MWGWDQEGSCLISHGLNRQGRNEFIDKKINNQNANGDAD